MALEPPMDWPGIETAVKDWIVAVTDLTDVVWSGETLPAQYPYAILSMGELIRVGGQDELRYTTDLGRPAGEEVGIEAVGLRKVVLSCDVYVGPPDSTDPSKHARHLLSVAQSSLSLPSITDDLRSAGLAVITDEGVENLDEEINSNWVSHGRLKVHLGLASSIGERTGYIKTVEISSEGMGQYDFNEEILGDAS